MSTRNRFEIVQDGGFWAVIDRHMSPGSPHRRRAEFTQAKFAKAWITRERKLIRDRSRRERHAEVLATRAA